MLQQHALDCNLRFHVFYKSLKYTFMLLIKNFIKEFVVDLKELLIILITKIKNQKNP